MAETAPAQGTNDLGRLKARDFETVVQTFGERDCMLYALGLGIGSDPCSAEQLRFVQGSPVQVLPTIAAVLAGPGEWMRDPSVGLRWERLVALSHHLQIHCPIPASGTVCSRVKVTDVFDRGAGRGALIHWERELTDASTHACLAVLKGRALARGDGGFGGCAPPVIARDPEPEGPAPIRWRWPTLPMQALVYRLSGDFNPVHADPEVAKASGFDRPILHGLCTLGIACFAIVSRVCHGNPAALSSISARYTGVVYPGETLEVQIWNDGPTVRFRCRVEERDSIVVDGGAAQCDVLRE